MTHASDVSVFRSRPDLLACAVLSGIWLIPILVIGVHGNFPLNDDWAYARATQALLETGLIERVSWTWTPIIAHSALGAASSWLLGFSFESLRWSCVFMGWVGMLGCFALARQAGVATVASAFIAAVIGLNPVYINLAFTYMTDIPFAASCVWSLYFLMRGISRKSDGLLAVGVMLALSAMLSRQAAIAIPMALGVALVLAAPKSARSWLTGAVAMAVMIAGYQGMLQISFGPMDSGRIFSTKNYVAVGVDSFPLFSIVRNGINTMVYLGCFLAPVAMLMVFRLPARVLAVVSAGAGLVTAAGLFTIARLELDMPPGMNVIYNLGLGPATIHGESARAPGPEWIWWCLCGLGFSISVFAAASVVVGAWPRLRELRERPDWMLLLAFPAIYLAPHLIRSPYFDRYLLPMLAPLMIGLFVYSDWSAEARNWAIACASGLFVLYASYGVLGTLDYMERQRAGWDLMYEQMDAGVEAMKLDGGFEFRGWYQFEPYWRGDRYIWRYGGDDEYRLSYDDTSEGYREIANRSFRQWLPPQTETLRVFHRMAVAQEAASGK